MPPLQCPRSPSPPPLDPAVRSRRSRTPRAPCLRVCINECTLWPTLLLASRSPPHTPSRPTRTRARKCTAALLCCCVLMCLCFLLVFLQVRVLGCGSGRTCVVGHKGHEPQQANAHPARALQSKRQGKQAHALQQDACAGGIGLCLDIGRLARQGVQGATTCSRALAATADCGRVPGCAHPAASAAAQAPTAQARTPHALHNPPS